VIRWPRIALWHVAATAGFGAVIALCLAFVYRDRWKARPLAEAPAAAPAANVAPTTPEALRDAALKTAFKMLERFGDDPANDDQPADNQKPADGKPHANEPPKGPPGGKPPTIDDKPAADNERGGDDQPDFPPGFDMPPEFDDLPGMDELRRLIRDRRGPGGAGRRRTPDGWEEVETSFVGTSDKTPFKRLVAADGFLYGVEYDTIEWFGEKCLARLATVVSVDQRPGRGKKRVVARDGYAVGAVNVYSKKYVNAMQLVFMRKVANDRLDPDDTYTSEWFGEPGPGQVTTLGGDGARPIGFHLYEGLVVEALALVSEVERDARRAAKEKPASKPMPRPGRLWDTEFAGDARSHDRERLAQPGAYLYGIECDVGESFFKKRGILRLIPIFRPDEPAIGVNRAIARKDYAVGAVNVLAQENIEALQLVFMRIRDTGALDPDDSYTSDWLGSRREPVTLTGDGARVVGIQVRQGLIVNAMSLVLAGGKPTSFVGDQNGGGLRQLADTRAMMFGVDYRLGSFGEKCIAELLPVFRRDSPSKLEGRLVAREAYAVGAVNVMSQTYVNALQLVYMRIRPGKGLNPDDSYTSDWIGYGGAPTSVSGDGVRIVGIVTEKQWDLVSALALVAEDAPR
jgi:hypothetical protein